MQRSKWLSLLVLSTVLSTAPAFAKAAAPTLAAEKAAARVPKMTRPFRRDPELPSRRRTRAAYKDLSKMESIPIMAFPMRKPRTALRPQNR